MYNMILQDMTNMKTYMKTIVQNCETHIAPHIPISNDSKSTKVTPMPMQIAQSRRCPGWASNKTRLQEPLQPQSFEAILEQDMSERMKRHL